MAVFSSLSQVSLAATMLTAVVGTYVALSPPHPSTRFSPSSTDDTIRRLHLTSKHTTKVILAPLGLLALHTSSLVLLHPSIHPSILRHGAENGLNLDLITWSTATSVPLAVILCVGIPLRLVPYASLGKNFTFELAKPDRLTTSGIYRFVQHPSYVGIVALAVCNVVLLGRTNGALSCWIPPPWYQAMRTPIFLLEYGGLSLLLFAIWKRVKQEERMLRAEFGVKWERWHARTARFIPWVF